MLEEVLDCIRVCEDGEINENLEPSMLPSLQKYTNIICKQPEDTVWYDKIEKVCFGKEQTFYHNPYEFSFFSDELNFFSNNIWGMKHVEEKFGNVLGNSVRTSEDYIIQNNSELDKFKDKTILIVGAGPSALDYDWQIEECDYVWSCTKFYLNEKLLNKKLGLVTIGGNVDLEDPKFVSSLENTGAMCGFECGVSPFKELPDIAKFKNKFKDNVFYFHSRYFSKLGAVSRLICLAAFLGVKEVKVIGFDGNPVGQKHAFEDNKVHDEVWRNDASVNIYRRQMILFWEYVSKFDTKITNLGEGHPNNLSTDITKNIAPNT